MCGIVGYTGSGQAAPMILEGLKTLEYRGYDSAGIAVVDGDLIRIEKVSGRVANLCEKTDDGRAFPGLTGIGHTRWATHGAPTDINAHPHVSNDGRFAIVHNGIVENFMELRGELEAKGYIFDSDTDTEVIVHLLSMYYDGDFKSAVMKTTGRLVGSYALGIVCTEHPGVMYAVRESSPLILGIGVGENYFASDVTALVAHTRNIYYMDNGEFAMLTPDEIKIFDVTGKQINKPVSHINWSVEASEKGGYEHFMLKEINEEPGAVKACIDPRVRGGEVKFEDFDLSSEKLKNISKILITACGSAYHAGFCARYAIEKFCGIPVELEIASELRYRDPIIDEHTLLLVISQSGETADTIAAMRECMKRGATSISIVNVVGSTIANISDHVIYTYAGPEIAVATTKGFTTQVAALYLLALYIGRKLGRVDDATLAKMLGEIRRMPKYMQQTFDMNRENLPVLAKKLAKADSLFFLGRNTDYAVAMEGALKMKEISYIHSESYAAGELKHGTIALIEEGTIVIAACCNDKLTEKMMSNIIEVKARGAEVIALAFKGNTDVVKHADESIFIPKVETLFSAALEVLPLQLLAYYAAKENGCDIDKPKNLAKSVTVE